MENYSKQLSLFDMEEMQPDIPKLLEDGQRIYIVYKADIIPSVVRFSRIEKSFLEMDYYRRYIVDPCPFLADVTNDSIGDSVFTTLEAVEAKVKQILKGTHDDVILASDIKVLSVEAYAYTRETDSHTIILYIADIGNDMYLVKGYMTYERILIGKEKAYGDFKEEQKKVTAYGATLRPLEGYKPEIKNMYRCSDHTYWDYTVSECAYAIWESKNRI